MQKGEFIPFRLQFQSKKFDILVIDKLEGNETKQIWVLQKWADYQRIINIGLTRQQLQYEQKKSNPELAKPPNAKVMGIGKYRVILDAKN